jgi:capsular exopolysaccharide synthesis family protein
MSIIEQALDKNRAKQAQAKRTRPLRPGEPASRGDTAIQQALIDADARIVPLAVSIDSAACRERRILLQDSNETEQSAVAAYRMLRTRLLHRARTNGWSVIAVTSAGANDGKTLTVLNLALSMSREKSRDVVLLDLDMRNPSVCRALDVHPPHDISEYLERGADPRQLFFSVGTDNLLIAGCVKPSENASELLASPRFEELIDRLKRGTVEPIILIDLPPVLLTDDALVLAPKVDAVLLVASEGTTGRANFTKALDVLAEFPVIGVVLNRASETAPGYEYAYGQ